MIPPSQHSQDFSQDPTVQKIKQCLDDMNAMGTKKDAIMNDGMNLSGSFNIIEELMEVYYNRADKNTVFESFKQRLNMHFD